MISLKLTCQKLGARAEDLADLLLISPRSVYYILSGQLNVPPEYVELLNNIRLRVGQSQSAPANSSATIALNTRYRKLLQRRLPGLKHKEAIIAIRIKKSEPALHALNQRLALISSLENALAPAGLRSQFAEWKQLLIHRTTLKIHRSNPQRVANDRIRQAALKAEIEAIEKVLAQHAPS